MRPLLHASLACLAATSEALQLASATALQPMLRTTAVQRTRTVAAQYQQPQLPPGWEMYNDEQGQVYYGNVQTGMTQWEVPIYHYGDLQSYQQPSYQQESTGNVLSEQDEEVVTYISERLQEPQLRIVRAVVLLLGTATALDLLAQTEQVQAAGGMFVPETGKPRTSGGVYLALLKSATSLPRESQDAALQRIKIEGKKVKSWEKASVPWY